MSVSTVSEIEDFLEAMDYADLGEARRNYVRLCVSGFWLGDQQALDVVTRHTLANAEQWAEGWEDLQWLRDGTRRIRREAGLPEVYDV